MKPEKPELHADAVPVRLVIVFVGAIGVMSLLIAAWLFWLGKSGEGVLAITNGCVMGLLGLLARTETRQRQSDDRREPVEVTATEPIPVENVTDEPESEELEEAPTAKPSRLAKAIQK